MKIVETYSHLNGLEFLLVHKPDLWKETQAVIASLDASKCKTKVSKEKTMRGKLLFSPIDMNAAFRKLLRARDWQESRVNYWVTKSEKLIRKTLTLPPNVKHAELFLKLQRDAAQNQRVLWTLEKSTTTMRKPGFKVVNKGVDYADLQRPH